MKSRCCTFYRNTSEGPLALSCTFRAQVASLPPPPPPPGGPGRKERVASQPLILQCPLLSPRWTSPGPRAAAFTSRRLSFFLMLLDSLPAASWLPRQKDKADIHEALPKAIFSSSHCPGAGGLNSSGHWRGRVCLLGPDPLPHPAQKHAIAFSPHLPHFLFVFCFGDVFHNYLKDRKQGVPKSRIGVCRWALGFSPVSTWGAPPLSKPRVGNSGRQV